jgi:putative hydrolases of HD superfamily
LEQHYQLFFSAQSSIVSIDWVGSVLDKANDLKQLPRTGWLLAGVNAPESVAAHSYATAILALLLADVINADWSGQGLARPLDSERILRIALIHDLTESLLTDLPKVSAELLGREAKLAAEAYAAQQIFATAPDSAVYADLWAEYAAGATPEAQVVRDADKLELVHQALRYEAYGHPNLAEFRAQPQLHFAASASLYQRLVASRLPLPAKGSANVDG